MKEIIELKNNLFQFCLSYVEGKIKLSETAMQDAQDAANNETKSSAGDKYETGRAMMQLERDKHARKLSEAIELKNILSQIKVDVINYEIKKGSLVITSMGSFFISISAGKIKMDEDVYFAVSENAPIIQRLKKIKIGERTLFNGRELILKEVK